MDALDDKTIADAIRDPRARELVARYQRTVALLELKVQSLEERLRLERIARYGSRSEKLSDLQLSLLDFEPAVSSEEIAAESERPPLTASEENLLSLSAKSKQRKHPGRNKLPAHLPRIEKIIVCTAQECLCGKCGATTKVIGYEECEVLDVKPAEYFVTMIKREKRACTQCMNNGVQTDEKKGTNHTAYFWQYGSPGKGVVFDFRMGRDREGPRRFLNDYAGILQTDGYGAYRNGIGGKSMVHACCLAHARRKFVDAVKVNEYDLESARVVEWMDTIFAIDRGARDAGMSVEDRHVLRSERAPQLLGQIHEKMLAMQAATLPKSKAGEAVRYTLSLWRKLTLFLEHPVLELSNNLAENSMRTIAIGRRNWLHLGSKEAGPKIAAIFSIVESCRRLKIPIRPYLADTLPGLAARSIQTMNQFTPTAYAAKLAR